MLFVFIFKSNESIKYLLVSVDVAKKIEIIIVEVEINVKMK